MRNLVLSAVLAIGLMGAGVGLGTAQAQYGHHHHGNCGTGYGGYNAGYGSYRPNVSVYNGGYGYGGYSAGYGSYRNVPPVALGQIYTQPVYRTLPYSSNFGGGYYGSGLNGMRYSNFGTGLGYGYGPGISIGIGGYGGHRF